MKRICTQCNVEKELTEFYKNKEGKHGHLAACKECTKAKTRETRKISGDVIRERERAKFQNDSIAREKKNAMTRDWRKRMKAEGKQGVIWHKHLLKTKYGKTPEEFEAEREAQNNACAICEEPFRKTPHNDHDHVTGKNRSLLCDSCNLGLGKFKDSASILFKATAYLMQHAGA